MVPSDEESTTDEEMTKLQRFRITKKKTYFDLTKHGESNQKAENNYETKFPLVNKSGGFIKVIDSKLSDSESDTNKMISSIQNKNNKRSSVPWHLLYAEPTRPEEIEDGPILDQVLKSQEQMEQKEETKGVKFKHVEHFIKIIQNIKESFRRTKKISKPTKKILIVEGLLPEEEFAKLKRKCLERSLIADKSLASH